MTDRELMQQALDALEAHADFGIKATKPIEALRARLAQPEQEPVFDRRWSLARDGFGLERDDECGNYIHIDDALAVLHTAPPQREWQGLTDEEIENCFEMSMFGTCRAIEAKLKAKNA